MTGSQLQIWCSAHPLTATVDTDSMCNTWVLNVTVCFLDSIADIYDKTDIFDLTCASSILEGPWSEEEESKLLHAMEELAKGKTDLSARGCWVSVSKALGATQTSSS